MLIEVLDLEEVARLREFGSFGINRPWDQIAGYGTEVELPIYAGGRINPPA